MNKEVINELYNNSLSIQALFVLIAFDIQIWDFINLKLKHYI